jgi:hypothetical protein
MPAKAPGSVYLGPACITAVRRKPFGASGDGHMRATKRIASVAAATIVAGLSACAGSDDGEVASSDRIARTGASPAAVGPQGRLTAQPAPLTLADLRKQPKGSPQAAVLELWFWGQWGSAPNIVAAYMPRIRSTIGVSNITGAYAQQRVDLLDSLPRIAAVRRTKLGAFVGLEILTKQNEPRRESFLLQQPSSDGWRVAYDTLLERALAGYVQTTVQSTIDPNAERPAARAIREGVAVAQTYRDAFASSLAPRIPEVPVPSP